jgi:hypothetical protein
LLALCARSGAFLLPLVVSGVVAVLVLDAFTGWTAAWRLVAWTCVVVCCTLAALVCLPVAKRLSILGALLALDVEFPSAPPSRVRLAAGASTRVNAQLELARTARADSSDALLTARLATASMLGVFRTIEVGRADRLRVFSTVGIALCVAVAALLVVPDRAESPQSPLGAGQQATSPTGRAPTETKAPPATPDDSNAGGGAHGDAGAVSPPASAPSVPETGSAGAVVAPPAEPELVASAPDRGTGSSGARSSARSSARPATEDDATAPPAPPSDVGARAADTLAPSALTPAAPAQVATAQVATAQVATAQVATAPVATAAVAPAEVARVAPAAASIVPAPAPADLAPAAVGPAAVAPDVVTPTWTEPASNDVAGSDDVAAPPPGGDADVGPPAAPAHDADRSTEGSVSENERPSTDAPPSVEHEPVGCHLSE